MKFDTTQIWAPAKSYYFSEKKSWGMLLLCGSAMVASLPHSPHKENFYRKFSKIQNLLSDFSGDFVRSEIENLNYYNFKILIN